MKTKKIILFTAIILSIILVGVFAYGYIAFSKVNIKKISKNDSDLGINKNTNYIPDVINTPPVKEDNDRVINIALMGGDKRSKNDTGRTDAIIILTIDEVHKKIKISSIMRDAYVSVYGYGNTKINHSYAYGGPQLLIKTLNQTFNLDIRDYVYVDFFGLEKLVDALGGVDINVKKNEISWINTCIRETSMIKKRKPHYIKKPGMQNLTGEQALGYVRIRYVGNGDFDRTERQREVLSILFNKIKDAGPLKYSYIALKMLPFVETSFDKTDIINLGLEIFSKGISSIEQQRFPVDGYWQGKTINKIWYLAFDTETTKDQIHDFIYDDVVPVKKQ